MSIDFTVMCQRPGCAASEAPGVAWGGTLLCGLHVRGLKADVDDIARVLSLIEADASALHSPVGSDGTGGSTPGSRPPMRLAVLDVVTGQTAAAITGWAADVVRTSRALTVAQAARMLARNVDALMVHPAVGDVVVELRDAATSCRAAIPDDRWNSTEQDARPRTVGRCAEVARRRGVRRESGVDHGDAGGALPALPRRAVPGWLGAQAGGAARVRVEPAHAQRLDREGQGRRVGVGAGVRRRCAVDGAVHEGATRRG